MVPRIPDVVAHDRENPLFEVSGESELLLIVLLLRFFGLSPLVDIDAAANETRERSGVVRKRNTAIEDPPVQPVIAS